MGRSVIALTLLAAALLPGAALAQRSVEAPTMELPGKTEPPAKPAAPAARPAPAGQTADEQADLKAKTLEERVTDLKEKIFRTKARLMNLQEMVIGGDITAGAKAVLLHRNEMGSSFLLESAAYALDGAPIYTKVDQEG
ncbi:MAG TPA: dihydrolipoamide acetyltransferase, partial [Anaeromyxobacteraceae bacterium]|nr:dihydrolipoamide acetyltransferase [Anaeromyxobacteraceae bacterium]